MKKGKFLFRPAMFLVVAVILLATSCQNDEGEVQIIQNEALVGFESQPIQGQFIVTLNGESSQKVKFGLQGSKKRNEEGNFVKIFIYNYQRKRSFKLMPIP